MICATPVVDGLPLSCQPPKGVEHWGQFVFYLTESDRHWRWRGISKVDFRTRLGTFTMSGRVTVFEGSSTTFHGCDTLGTCLDASSQSEHTYDVGKVLQNELLVCLTKNEIKLC